MPKIDNQIIELALFGLVALAMVVQALVLLVTFFALRKATQSADKKLEELRATILPVIASVKPMIDTSRDMFINIAPRIESASKDVAEIARSLRLQTAELQSATVEIVARAKGQAGRVDTMLSGVLDSVDRAGNYLAGAVNKPIRQVSALLASIKAAIESLRTSVPPARSQSNHAPDDNDIFV